MTSLADSGTKSEMKGDVASSSSGAAKASKVEKDGGSVAKKASEGDEEDGPTAKDYYFDSYSHFGIHEEMLKDTVRTESYRKAITGNKHLFKDKVVLDVGCGTGILSMFAAQAGAKKVIAVECSGIIDSARKIIKANGFENTITLVKGKIEEIDIGVDEVDIIISEWMGYFLLYESMLDSVIFARDKWLRKDGNGLIFPDKSSLYLAAIEDGEYMDEKINYWDNVYGFDMSCIKETAMLEPLVDEVSSEAVISSTDKVITIDIMTCTVEDLQFKVPFELKMQSKDFAHAIVAWFDIEFSCTHKPKSSYFSTGPNDEYTHWKQTVLYMNETLTVDIGDSLKGSIYVRPNAKNHRDIDITVDYAFESSTEGVEKVAPYTQEYRLR